MNFSIFRTIILLSLTFLILVPFTDKIHADPAPLQANQSVLNIVSVVSSDSMYVSDTTLVGFATIRPVDREAMLGISGVGQSKLERYGDAFLEVILAHQK